MAALQAGTPGARYLLGGEDAPQMRVFDIVRRLTGRPQPRRIPGWLASPAALADELMAAWFRRPPLLTTGTLEILLRDWPLGHARAAEELGYRVTPLEDGVARLVNGHPRRSGGGLTMFSETARQIVHMSMGVFALLLRALTWWQAALCAIAALVFNAVVLPRMGGRTIIRPVDASRGYPLRHPALPPQRAAADSRVSGPAGHRGRAWGILAFGDGAATLAGRRWGRHRLAWNPDKTVEGLLAFISAGGAAAVFLAWWTAPAITPPPSLAFILVAPVLAALAAGLVETVPIALDDNISVPASAGAVLWLCSLATAAAWTSNRDAVAASLAPALVVNTVAAAGGWLLRTVRVSGMIGGWAIGVAVFACLGARRAGSSCS